MRSRRAQPSLVVGATTPLFHLELPDTDGPEHFAPLQIALEGLTAINQWHIERALRTAKKGYGPPLPPLYASGVRYQEDPPGHEDWRDVWGVLRRGVGDCVPLSSLVLRSDYELVPLIDLAPGDRIMGEAGWTTVLDGCVTGEKQILSFRLSNGCSLRCSPDHRLFRDVDGKIEEIRASEARVGDDLVTLRAVPIAGVDGNPWPEFAAGLTDEERAWLLGVFVADGWVGYHGHASEWIANRLAISGLDGKPKEIQKRRVASLMEKIGAPTRWHAKYIAINEGHLARFFAACGHTAPHKRMPSLALPSETAVRAAIEGLAADAGYSDPGNPDSSLVFGTTSPTLALQLRILYRMLGHSVSIRRVEDHGGLGENAIYRVTPRMRNVDRRDKRFARIRAIADGGLEPCGDITTDTGKFWLPESDVVVHNCDQLTAWRVAELRVAGISAEPVLKWQWVPREVMIKNGYPGKLLPGGGVWLVHCLVRYPDGSVEDPSKILGMGGNFLEKI